MNKINLLNLHRQGMEALFQGWGEPSFRATQLLKWIHQQQCCDFDSMSNFSKNLREKLSQLTEITPPEFSVERIATDGTIKWLCRLPDGNSVETVYIPEPKRATLCISSQVGCALDCQFCATGKQGFNRNLETAEIIGQLWLTQKRLAELNLRPVSNVVMMGMGEPLLNLDNVVNALKIMCDDFAYGLAKRRVTVSTSGLVPAMDSLNASIDIALAVSLHAPNDELRTQLMPINKKYPLADLMAACRRYTDKVKGRKVTMEYVMLAGINDSPKHAKQLKKLLADIPSKVNLIPFNPIPQAKYTCSSMQHMREFQATLMQAGIVTTIRKTRGDDTDSACGQLVGDVHDRTRRSQRYKAIDIDVVEESN